MITKNNKTEDVRLAIVLGYIAIKELQNIEQKIEVLTNLGYSNNDIAVICKTNSDSVRAFKSKIRKGKSK